MNDIFEEAAKIRKVLGLPDRIDIVAFLLNVPQKDHALRKQLCLQHFIRKKNKYPGQSFDYLQEADDILNVVENVKRADIIEQLISLQCFENRKEIVIQQLLYQNPDIQNRMLDLKGNYETNRGSVLKENVVLKNEAPRGLGDTAPTDQEMKQSQIEELDLFLDRLYTPKKEQQTEEVTSTEDTNAKPVLPVMVSEENGHPPSPLDLVMKSEPGNTFPTVVSSTSIAPFMEVDAGPSSDPSTLPLADHSQGPSSVAGPSSDRPMLPDLQDDINYYFRQNFPSYYSSGPLLGDIAAGPSSDLPFRNTPELPKPLELPKPVELPKLILPISLEPLEYPEAVEKINTLYASDSSASEFSSSDNSDALQVDPMYYFPFVKEKNKRFNLVNHLKDVTSAHSSKIFRVLRHLKLDHRKKPLPNKLSHAINLLLGPDSVINVQDSDDTDSDDDYSKRINNPSNKNNNLNNQPRLRMILDNVVKGSSVILDSKVNVVAMNDNMAEAGPSNCKRKKKEVSNLKRQKVSHSPDINMEPLKNEDLATEDLKACPASLPAQFICHKEVLARLKEMFPDACPNYLAKVCHKKPLKDFDDILDVIFSAGTDYPKRVVRAPSPEREIEPEEYLETLKNLFPDADPTFLQMQCNKFLYEPGKIQTFIEDALENHNYPTMKEYLRKQQISSQQKQYTTDFNVENFVQIFPDPKATFSDPNRLNYLDQESANYCYMYFRNKFSSLPIRSIQLLLKSNNNKGNFFSRCLSDLKHLESAGPTMKSKRKPMYLPTNFQNIPLLQEIAYHEHINEIEQYLDKMKQKDQEELAEAKAKGLLYSCNCCYDDEVMPKNILTCTYGCKFCKECIKRSTEVAFGSGKVDFSCLSDCTGEFGLQTLQNVLPPKMFSKIAQKKALAEVKAAGIEDLETCPFCDFATIPHEADKIFRCLNPDCMKESCRLCKEPSHVPLKCEEVEKDADIQARTYVENQMTEALLRTCWKCGTKFFKEEGCNKMTCQCGAKMCYICKKPVNDYKHFNGNGGDRFDLCPLYSDTNAVNVNNVLKGAEKAKAEIGVNNFKIDPTSDVKKHYANKQKNMPPGGLERGGVFLNINMPHHRPMNMGHDPQDFMPHAFNAMLPNLPPQMLWHPHDNPNLPHFPRHRPRTRHNH